MARLTDLTLHDQFHPAEGQRQFQHRANYVSDLYQQFLHGYKPPNTSRISITLVAEQKPTQAWIVGSVAVLDQYAHAPTYDALSDPAKLSFLLDRLHEAVGNLCRAFHWDEAVFDHAYHQVQKQRFVFRFEFPEKVTRDGKKRAHLLLEKTLTHSRLSACLDAGGSTVRATLYEGPNRWWYDPVYALTKRGKWITNDQFGVHTTCPYFRAWYSLPLGIVGTE
ncbi:hypothetical protein HMJ29_11120 [Hymenobacter taeanensis]|uniref:Uncharacterized protein n=1 Tax=Hymenobacter taeanensis TaxID=2735321 RepID=A0A6M6BHT1_9BACT|nr:MULTISPECIES: hypothetical protein [Hymenobacter]QJX47458.1 hypothetical protein HMJ29_11120 [Hymenobacter taeanensis]UOQ83058.1 hypothetical protein MUN83_09990 [Hymenobacter sp. 5414T-23]